MPNILNKKDNCARGFNEIDFDLQMLNIIREIHMMQRKDIVVDLHTHTNFSDGFLSPKELFRKATKNDIDIIAITDHNTVGGVIELLKIIKKVNKKLQKKIYVIPGIEISTAIYNKRIHIVGLFVNIYSPHLLDCIEKVRKGHFERAKIQLSKLEKIGIPIKFEEYRQIVKDRVPNWKTIAETIVQHGYASSIEDARISFTKKGKPAHVSYIEKWHKISPTSAITAIKRAGGLAFVAHLGDIEGDFGERDTKKIVSFLIENGLDGVDLSIRNKQHSSVPDSLMNFINSKGLPTIIGSDFHKDENLLRLRLNTTRFYHILHKKIQYVIQDQQYNNVLKHISFNDLRFFPPQIIPNDFLDYEAGIRKTLLEQRLNSPYLLIKDLISKDSDNSLFWKISFGSMLFAISTVKAEHCLNKNVHKEPSVIRKFISDRVQKTIDIKHVEGLDALTKEFLEDNLSIYSPIAYRLCYYDLGYKLRTESLMRLYPKLSSYIERLYNNIIDRAFGLTRENIEEYRKNKKNYLYSILSEMGYQDIEIHSRIKPPISLWNKLKICWLVGHDWKNPEFKKDAAVFLKKVRSIWKGKNPDHIDSKGVRSIFEDFIAFRLVIKNSSGIDVYRDISNAANMLLDKVYKIELKPRRWNHKRLLIWGWDKYSQNELPVEIQCMNWVDYLSSRAYYWYSKGIYIYQDVYSCNEPRNYDKITKYFKNSKFEDLHNMMLEEIKINGGKTHE